MKKILLFIFIAFTVGAAAQQNNIKFFNGTWDEALQKATNENKMIFLDCNTTWCGPCKLLAANVFTQQKVADFYNKNFINVSMDMEKGKGLELMGTYSVSAYPTLLYIKPGGFKVNQLVGFTTPDSLIDAGNIALQKKDEKTLVERFLEGPRDTALIKEYYVYLISNTRRGSELPGLDSIVKQEGLEAFYQKKYWDILPSVDVNSTIGVWFAAHLPKFYELYGKNDVDATISEMYTSYNLLNTLWRVSNAGNDTSVIVNFKAVIADRNIPNKDFIYAIIDFFIAGKQGRQSDALAIADKALINATDWQYHQMARYADFTFIANRDLRLHASKWAAKAAAITQNKDRQKECFQVADDLLNEVVPSVYPSPKIFGFNV